MPCVPPSEHGIRILAIPLGMEILLALDYDSLLTDYGLMTIP